MKTDGMQGMMGGMNMTAPPPSTANAAAGGGSMMHNNPHMLMHMTFFWGKNTEILFHGWPGHGNLGMYLFALLVVFTVAFIVEGLSHSNLIKEDNSNNVVAGLVQTGVYGLRVGLGYLVMLSVMSFNGGVFVVALVGHTLGFLIFGSRVFKKSNSPMLGKTPNLVSMSC